MRLEYYVGRKYHGLMRVFNDENIAKIMKYSNLKKLLWIWRYVIKDSVEIIKHSNT